MSTRGTDYREAVDHLPEGATLVLEGISWEDYEQLLEDLIDRPGVRVTYDQGKLEISFGDRNFDLAPQAIPDNGCAVDIKRVDVSISKHRIFQDDPFEIQS